MLDTFQMVSETVFFHGTTFLFGRLLYACCVLSGDRTRNDSRVGRDLYRTRVLAPGDVERSPFDWIRFSRSLNFFLFSDAE